MFFKSKEVGKAISTNNMKRIQDIHDNTSALGAGCSYGGMSLAGGGIYESAKALEAALPMNTSHDALRGHVQKALTAHLGVKDHWSENGPWVHYNGMFPNHVIYDHKGQTYKHKYSVNYGAAGTDPEVKFSGEPKKVHTAYVDSTNQEKESMSLLATPPDELVEDYDQYNKLAEGKSVSITLQDGEVIVSEGVAIEMVKEAGKDGKISALPKPIDVKIIAPGWGSMAYYSKEMIQESGPKAFQKGTQMFWNHATGSQEAERPEGDLNDLAAILTEDAKWQDNGPNGKGGPGLYAKAKVFSDYAQQVAEKGPHIGVSINAGIKCHEGEAEGKSGRIADKFVHAFSADFVTKAGAGGAPIVPVTESLRGSPEKEIDTMTEAEIKVLQDQKAALEIENAKLREGQSVLLAATTVGTVLKEAGVKFNPKLVERACSHPVMKEGKLDQDWIKGIVADFSDGLTGGVKGLGDAPVKEGAKPEKLTEAEEKEYEGILKDLGMPEAGLKTALAVGR